MATKPLLFIADSRAGVIARRVHLGNAGQVRSHDHFEHGLVAEASLCSLRAESPDEIVIEDDRSGLRARA